MCVTSSSSRNSFHVFPAIPSSNKCVTNAFQPWKYFVELQQAIVTYLRQPLQSYTTWRGTLLYRSFSLLCTQYTPLLLKVCTMHCFYATTVFSTASRTSQPMQFHVNFLVVLTESVVGGWSALSCYQYCIRHIGNQSLLTAQVTAVSLPNSWFNCKGFRWWCKVTFVTKFWQCPSPHLKITQRFVDRICLRLHLERGTVYSGGPDRNSWSQSLNTEHSLDTINTLVTSEFNFT